MILNTGYLFSKGYGISSKAIWQDQKLDIYAKAIIHYFLSYTGTGNSVCFPSIARISADLKISKPKTISSIQSLVEMGFITVKKERKSGFIEKSFYTLTFFAQVNDVDLPGKPGLPAQVNDVDLHPVNQVYPNTTIPITTNLKQQPDNTHPFSKQFLDFLYELSGKTINSKRLYSKASRLEADEAVKASSFDALKVAYTWAKDQDFWKRIVLYPSHWSSIITQYNNRGSSSSQSKLPDPSKPRKFDARGNEI